MFPLLLAWIKNKMLNKQLGCHGTYCNENIDSFITLGLNKMADTMYTAIQVHFPGGKKINYNSI